MSDQILLLNKLESSIDLLRKKVKVNTGVSRHRFSLTDVNPTPKCCEETLEALTEATLYRKLIGH